MRLRQRTREIHRFVYMGRGLGDWLQEDTGRHISHNPAPYLFPPDFIWKAGLPMKSRTQGYGAGS